MSKTFKSFLGENGSRRLHVDRRPEGTNLWVSDNSWKSDYGITIAPSDAPALMLAIGECLPPIPDTVRDGSYEAFMAVALEYLGKAVRALETEAAEARERAELEAEALELFNTFWRSDGEGPSSIENWRVPNEEREEWLAVARKARELAKEATK